MPDYMSGFTDEDRERLFRFLVLFARWECALKRRQFVKKGGYGQAEADWSKFAATVTGSLAAVNAPAFTFARTYLLNNPPKQQCFENDQIRWRDNPRREDEGEDARYLFRVIRDVRNNLFHGGKYQDGLVKDPARDDQLVDSATAVLEATINVDAGIRQVFEEG
jgi:hypothetical protein